jgi:hypothetical protein
VTKRLFKREFAVLFCSICGVVLFCMVGYKKNAVARCMAGAAVRRSSSRYSISWESGNAGDIIKVGHDDDFRQQGGEYAI